MRVLLVEDDPMIGSAVQDGLREATYAVDWVRDGQAALDATTCQQYDLVVLDLGLPKVGGHEVLDALRRKGRQVPLVILTARDTTEDRVRGLDGGADDYVAKPFEMAELLARLRAVLRRRGGTASPLLGNHLVTLDPTTREARRPGGEPVRLSAREFALLHALLIRPGAILSRTQLEERIYGWGEEVESNAVEFLIHSLRRKLGAEVIRNVRGVGWMVPREQ